MATLNLPHPRGEAVNEATIMGLNSRLEYAADTFSKIIKIVTAKILIIYFIYQIDTYVYLDI
jgi:hypothetical protein